MDEKNTHPADPESELSADSQEPQTAIQADPETPPAEPEPSSPAATEPPAVVIKKGGGIATLSLLIALGAAGLAGYQWWNQSTGASQAAPSADLPDYAGLITEQGEQLKKQLDGRLSSGLTELRSGLDQLGTDVTAMRSALTELRSSQGEARGTVEQSLDEVKREAQRLRADREGLESSLVEVQESSRRSVSAFERRLGHLETSISALANNRTDNAKQLALAESEYLLRAASERLSLFDDPQGAGRALALAAEQLSSVDDPIFSTVRQTLANHRQALNQLELPDRVALSTQLLAMARSSVEWPLDARRSLNSSGANLLIPEAEEQGWWPRFKSVLSNVVVVHREKETATVLLTLEEERLLRENVRLQLQVAQLAAARGEQALYESSIGAVTDWIGEYYEPTAEPIAAALAQLEALAATELKPKLPDISQALRQLRNIRATETLAGQAAGDTGVTP